MYERMIEKLEAWIKQHEIQIAGIELGDQYELDLDLSYENGIIDGMETAIELLKFEDIKESNKKGEQNE